MGAPPAGIESRLEQAIVAAAEDPDGALAAAEQAEADGAGLSGDERAELHTLAVAVRGRVLAIRGSYREASSLLREALASAPDAYPKGQVRLIQALVFAAEKLGDVEDALAWAVRALETAHLTGDEELVVAAETSVGVARSRCGDAEGGLFHYRQVLAHFEATGQELLSVAVRNNIGINLKNLGRLDESLAAFERAAAIAAEFDRPRMEAVIRSNMGETLWLLGRHAEARAMLSAVIKSVRTGGWASAEINALINLGRVLTDLGEDAEARATLQRAVEAIEASEERSYASDAHLALAELHKRAGRFELALRHHEAYHREERAVFDANFERQVAAQRVRLEVEEARHEAEVERLRLVEVGRAHEELRMLHEALVATDAAKTELLAQLDQERRTDALTGLLNRRSLDERLREEAESARRAGAPLTLAMCDIDRFKLINDRYGHPCGDQVLQEVARLLRLGCRREDVVARYGGEEFCIGFVGTSLEDAVALTDRLRAAVAGHHWEQLRPGLQVTLSAGVAALTPDGDAGLLVASADAWLYAAKREGRDQVRWPAQTDAA